MATTIPSGSRALLALAGLALGGLAHAAPKGSAAAPDRLRLATPGEAISLSAAKTRIDYKTHHALLEDVVITQGDLKVTADRASATDLDFEKSRWTFTGNVHVSSLDHGELTSDTATIDFRDKQMQTAAVTGHPAEFEQTASKSGVLAKGHADSIVYTVAQSTVRLEGDAWLEYGTTKIAGPLLVYDIATQQLEAAGATERGGRVHITIRPKVGASSGSAAPPKGASPGKSP